MALFASAFMLASWGLAAPCASLTDPAAREEAYASYLIGQAAVDQGRHADALEPLLAAERGHPLLPQAPYALGQAFMGLRRFDEAVQAFTASRDVFGCLVSLGGEERAGLEKRLDQEIHALQDAIRKVERDDVAGAAVGGLDVNREKRRSRGETARLVHQLGERLAQLQDWKRRGMTLQAPPEVFVALGTALFQTNALQEAERELLAALAVDPKHGDAHHNLAVVYLATDRIAEAEKEVKLAERAGISVNPRLKEEIRKRKKK